MKENKGFEFRYIEYGRDEEGNYCIKPSYYGIDMKDQVIPQALSYITYMGIEEMLLTDGKENGFRSTIGKYNSLNQVIRFYDEWVEIVNNREKRARAAKNIRIKGL